MSKAFTKEDEVEPAPLVRPRAPLPDGVPNYVTGRGLAELHAELEALPASRETVTRRADLEERIASAEVVSFPTPPPNEVRFGATVTVAGRDGERSYQVVGVDEADAARGKIAFTSPLARALLGREVGDTVRFRTPGGEQELEIIALAYDP